MRGDTSVLKRAVARVLTISAIVLLGGFVAASLVRFSPGYGVDERELDSRLSSESIQALRLEHRAEPVYVFYLKFLRSLIQGDLGVSRTFDQPIAGLLRLRWKVSLQSLAYALPLSWFLVLAVVGWVSIVKSVPADMVSSAVAGAMLAIPVAMTAFFVSSYGKSAGLALVIVLAPTLFRFTRNIVQNSQKQPYVTASRARGIGPFRLLVRHVLPNAAPEIIGLAGVSVSLAIGALIPIEFLCDSAGVGQLALQAALARDLPLLVILTIFVTIITLGANLTADLLTAAFASNRA